MNFFIHRLPFYNKSRRRKLDGLLCSLILIVLAIGCSTEPLWKGKRLSTWLEDLDDLDLKKTVAAETALKRIGTNAIPYLMLKLTTPESSVSDWIRTGGRRGAEHTDVVMAFRVLGSSAAQTLPSLGSLLTNQTSMTNPGAAYKIAQSMAGIGEQAKPQLVAALNSSSPSIRRASLVGLIDLGKAANDAMPTVLERVTDSDAETRGLALFFVSDVAVDDEMKLRVFKEALLDSDRYVRSFAQRELRRFESK